MRRAILATAEIGGITRFGIGLMASLHGAGRLDVSYIFDVTDSYQAAFANGLGWNATNGTIVLCFIDGARGSAFA